MTQIGPSLHSDLFEPPPHRRLSDASVGSMVLIELSTGVKAREIAWILEDTREVIHNLKNGLDECYALLAPIDPGVTLAVSSQHDEKVKGVMTRLGTRIVKARIALRLQTLPHQTLSLDPAHPIHVPALEAIQTYLNESINLLSLSLDHPSPSPRPLADHLRVLSTTLASASFLLGGPNDPMLLAHPKPRPDIDPIIFSSWLSESCPPVHFRPALPPSLSVHLALDNRALVLALRALAPADAPVNLGTKLGLALGVVRPLEHDEMNLLCRFSYSRFTDSGGGKHVHPADGVIRRPMAQGESPPAAAATAAAAVGAAAAAVGGGAGGAAAAAAAAAASSTRGHGHGHVDERQQRDVFVREKVTIRVEDASLHILWAKLAALRRTLARARENLAAVMGEELHGREAWGEV
ncbi:hypothetical protein SODALDRAFT_330744 [Sodiomyces alkalinus F11]|uniref:RAVE subunit 2/Rogdi n=1 Tax=Sodiomyces alkalinus (strain CBS 110278 / VKM F-3762 / F11) TaxID=1314773 RepID=A0A3N2Q2S1_SODAK|nr:hypothetical protein SODALDRAFT_330744 [Sodiomyces alkalinus F11]ROT41027.1 hypothetical protein SODALDRAFT_330744 [Sodiomyces alkalinus F11]